MTDYTKEQRAAVTSLSESQVVTAGAGSGKTRVLVGRYVEALATRAADIDEIIAITFTEKAASEMKSRVWQEISARERAAATPEDARYWRGLGRRVPSARICTIDSFCLQLVREHPIEARVDPQFVIMDELEAKRILRASVRAALVRMLKEGDPHIRKLVLEVGFAPLVGEFERFYSSMRLTGQDFSEFESGTLASLGDSEPDDRALIRAVFRASRVIDDEYSRARGNGVMMDFVAVELAARDLLRDTEAGEECGRQYRFVMVDEYQDTNALQDQIVSLVVGKQVGNRKFIVGDPKQSIYRFRGARVEVFEQAVKGAEREGMRPLELAVNFRTQKSLVEVVNFLFDRVLAEQGFTQAEHRRTASGAGDIPRFELALVMPREAGGDPGSEPEQPGERESAAELEAQVVAARIARMVREGELLCCERAGQDAPDVPRPVGYKDIAVLMRAMTSVKIYERAFAQFGIPYFVVGGTGFYGRPEVDWVLNLLRAADDLADAISLASCLRSPMFAMDDGLLLTMVRVAGDLNQALSGPGLSRAVDAAPEEARWKLEFASEVIGRLRAAVGRMPVGRLVRSAIEWTGIEQYLATRPDGVQAIGNLSKLVGMAEDPNAGFTSLREFMDEVSYAQDSAAKEAEAAVFEESGDTVRIMTVHKAKGLEFPVVFVPETGRGAVRRQKRAIWFDPDLGVGIDCAAASPGGAVAASAAAICEAVHRGEEQESRRCLYVALTRAADYLVVSGVPKRPSRGRTHIGSNGKGTWLDHILSVVGDFIPPDVDERGAEIELPDGGGRIIVSRHSAAPRDVGSNGGALPGGGVLSGYGVPPGGAALPGSGGSTGDGAILRGDGVSLKEIAPLAAPAQAAAAPGGGRVSVSALMCYEHCARRYVYEYRYRLPYITPQDLSCGLDEHAAPVDALSAAQRGGIVHAVCERIREPEQADELLRAEIETLGLPPECACQLCSDLAPMVRAHLARFPITPSAEIRREAEFALRLDPFVVVGVVDRLVRRGAEAVVVDLKTNRIDAAHVAETAARYRVQLDAYALAASRSFGVARVRTVLHFLAPDEVFETVYSEDELAQAHERLSTLAHGAARANLDNSPAQRREECSLCPYSPLCGFGPNVESEPLRETDPGDEEDWSDLLGFLD
ncbi:MAG: UvrD-helicase domain-containing protein [Firmicutes bacterium]|nr:UvrD-helicase domain-containing protein [Bacillota bacterium]